MGYSQYKFKGDPETLLDDSTYEKILQTIESMDRMNKEAYEQKRQNWSAMMQLAAAIWGNGSKEYKRIRNVPVAQPKSHLSEIKRIQRLRNEEIRLADRREYARDYRRRVDEAVKFLESRNFVFRVDFGRSGALKMAERVRANNEYKLDAVP